MANNTESITLEIAKLSEDFNRLRASTVESDKAALEVTQKKLGELKKALGQAKAAAAGGKDGAGAKKKRERLLLKTAKVRWVPSFHPP